MPKKKTTKIGRRIKTHKKCSYKKPEQLFETLYMPMNEIIASNENHSVTIQQKHLCRTCLSENREFHTVFEECIGEMLTSLAAVKVCKDDGLPSYICKQCKSKLESAYAFQVQCQRSYYWLQNRKAATTSSNNVRNLKDIKITTCCNNTEFNEAIKKTDLGNNSTIIGNKEQKFIGGMPTYLATNVISSDGDCDIKETEIIFGNTKVSNNDTILIKTELEDIDFKMTENNQQMLIGEMTTPWITNDISSNSDCNLKDTKITMCCNNTEFNEAFKKPELGNNFKITKNNEQKFIGEMQTCLATNVISSNGDCDIKETEIIFGNTKVSNKDTILIKTELEDIDFKMTENSEQMLIGEMTTPWTTNKISSNSDNIKESEIVGNEQVPNKNVKAINTELEGNIGRNETSEEHDQLLDNAGKQPRRNGYACVKPSLDSQVRKHLYCRKCRIDFKSIEGFDAHNELIHFKCQHCRKRFPDRSLLKRHTCVHKWPQYFICTICGYTFKSKYCLAIHKKIHSQAFPYKCEICSKEFTSGMYLWKHNQIYHPHINGVFSGENSLK